MAIIDTLKLALSKGNLTPEAAETMAKAITDELGDDLTTKVLLMALSSTDRRLDLIESKLTVLFWAIGINAAATIAILVKHW